VNEVQVIASAFAMAWICADVRKLKPDIAGTVLMPVWICVAVAPSLLLVASGPWQPAQ
jgi:hypothetical protein